MSAKSALKMLCRSEVNQMLSCIYKEDVIKAWDCCTRLNGRLCEECPYVNDCCHDGLPYFVVANAVSLLKRQQKVVYCHQCKHYGTHICPVGHIPPDYWFCPMGNNDPDFPTTKQKDGEQNA